MIPFFKYFTISSFIALFAIIFQAYFESGQLQEVTEVLSSLMKLENVNRKSIPKVIIGYGSCSDLTVRAVDFLNYSENFKESFSQRDQNDDEINTFDDFMKSFLYYFSKGAAAERYTPNKEMFLNLVNIAKKHESHRWELGGNAAVMGTRFLIEKTEVLLAATMSDKQKTHLINGIDLVDFKPTKDFVDDIHLILEYKTGERFGEHVAPRANRYIIHSDANNPLIISLELLKPNALKGDLFVVSGLQMMDNYPFSSPTLRSERLEAVKNQIISLDKKTLTHFEMASFVEIELLNDLTKYILPYSDSIGLNEQEIDNLLHVLESGKISLVANSNPRVATTLDQMRKVFKILNRNYFANRDTDKNVRMLSRIHIHTLAFQLILNVKDSKWKNIKTAAAKSSLIAHRHVCQTSYVNPDNAILVLDDSFSTSIEENAKTDDVRPKRIDVKKSGSAISCWIEKLKVDEKNLVEVKICVAPVLVCREAKKTVGAGDNISASGLAMQI
ncbi:hypothetical protein PVAND_014120 [Polypedilum vanderplanki]|uniref:ADP-dependent glucokinase n=1 Tax=Polypedilum vanderplanki TaxID=319348 RepID=A0A9J6CT67_POLVA|nr:hypothetical protein PVAND_014120 [Polypedilum vanderplanki]